MAATIAAHAGNFTCEGIIYNVTGESTCEVGRQTAADISGAVLLPATVTDGEGNSYVLTAVSNYAFVTCSALTEVTIPETVTTLGNSSFAKCTSLKVVRFLGAPVSVGPNCFSESSSIAEVYTPGLASWISTDYKDAASNPLNYGAALMDSEGVAVDCSVIPEGTKRIGNYSLAGMENLDSVTLPEGLEELGVGAFTSSPVKYVNIPSLAMWAGMTFGSYTANPLYSGKAMLVIDGKEVRDLDIPEGATAISNYAFMNYVAAGSITVPNSVESIGAQSFSGCTGVKRLSLGGNVTKIGMNAFQKVDLTDIMSYAVNPPELARNSFTDATCSAATLIVPRGSLEAYKAASYWKKFLNIVEDATTGIDSVDGSDMQPAEYYSLDGRKVENPSAGIYIRRSGNSCVKVIIK